MTYEEIQRQLLEDLEDEATTFPFGANLNFATFKPRSLQDSPIPVQVENVAIKNANAEERVSTEVLDTGPLPYGNGPLSQP